MWTGHVHAGGRAIRWDHLLLFRGIDPPTVSLQMEPHCYPLDTPVWQIGCPGAELGVRRRKTFSMLCQALSASPARLTPSSR